jgi:hypothetical protein
MVMSEGGQWSYPIRIFENDAVETFVPDITSSGWISWHVAEFRQKGTYFTYLYIYSRRSHQTGRETIYVNPRANTVVVVRPLQAPVRINISKAPTELSKSIMRITAIVTKETKGFRGATIQDSNERDRVSQARMAMCSGVAQPNPDCNLSDAEFLKKHPVHPRPTPHLISGAVPGVNCGLGTDKSCYEFTAPK